MLLIPKGIQADNILTTDKVQFLDTTPSASPGLHQPASSGVMSENKIS
jgi:hypothetical protein